MKIFNKKSDILRDLGKDAKDIRYLERAIERGEIVSYGGYFIKKDEFVGEAMRLLYNDNQILRARVENFSEAREKIDELETNVEYYKNEAEEANDKVVALESVLDNLRAKGLDI
jgi:predicted metal-dependent phosphotriesterase family hydrolase